MNLMVVKKSLFGLNMTPEKFMPEFWEKTYDAEGYTWYKVLYQYNNENAILFMTSNLVSGFLQRCQTPMGKYALGVMNVSGKSESEGPFTVSGVWCIRGTKIPATLMDCPGAEYYDWTKIDVSSEEGRASILSAMADDVVDGLEVFDRKWFK